MKTYIAHVTTPLMILLLSLFLPIGLAGGQEALKGEEPSMQGSGIVRPNTPQPARKLAIPQEVTDAKQLRQSLKPDQVARIQQIVKQYQPQLYQINIALSSSVSNRRTTSNQASLLSKEQLLSEQSTLASQAATEAAQIKSVTAQTIEIQKKINSEVNSLLDPIQQANYTKATTASQQKLQKLANKLADVTQQAVQQSAASTQSSSYCWNAAYYGALADYWSWYVLWYFSYYDYIYYGGYGYYDYYYGDLAESYATSGLLYASGAYFDSAYGFYYDSNDWGYYAYYDLNSSQYYQYYQWLYAYYNWIYYGSSYYGYYAYIYGYNYPYYYEGLAMNNAYYCS